MSDAPAPVILRVIDFETTSLESTGDVIEYAYTDLDRNTGLITPGAARLYGAADVPPETRAVHHIWPEDLAGLDRFDPEAMVDEALAAGVAGMAAHQSEFEGKWVGRYLEGNIPLVCTYKAALRTWPDAPSHGNFALLYWLKDAGKVTPDRALIGQAHRALPDTYATAWLLKALFDSGVTGKEMAQWTREPRMLPRCPIGKFRGKPWGEVETGFLRWMLNQNEMEPDLKWLADRELTRRHGQ